MLKKATFAILILATAVFLMRTADVSIRAEMAQAQVHNTQAPRLSETTPTPQPIPKAEPHALFELLRGFESGEQSSDDLQNQIAQVAGESSAAPWDTRLVDKPMRLSLILSHVQNLENNFELLMTHSLAQDGQPDDVITQYTSRVSEAEQKNILGALVVAHKLTKQSGRLVFQNKQKYGFSLKSEGLAGPFSLRKPEGEFSFSEAREGTFDPLELLGENTGHFEEIEDGLFEIPIAGLTYLVSVTPRKTELETVTIEIEMREKDSLLTHSYVLVYE